MLCVLVELETQAVSVSLLAGVLFLKESEAFPGGRAQCLVRTRGGPALQLSLTQAGLRSGGKLAFEGVGLGLDFTDSCSLKPLRCFLPPRKVGGE